MIQKIKKYIVAAFDNTERNNSKAKIAGRTILCLLILAFGIMSFLLLSSVSHKPNKKSSEKLLKTLITIPVNIQDYRYEFIGYGTVKPSTEITVSAEINGHVVYENPDFAEGNFVEKDTVLLKIDDIDYQLALKEAETQVISYTVKIEMMKHDIEDGKEMLKTKLKFRELEENDYNRRVELREKDAISIRSLEDARKELSTAKYEYIKADNEIKKNELELTSLIADLARAKVKRKQAQLNLEKSSVKAPISGRLENISISGEEFVSVGTTLFEINKANDVDIDVPIEIDDALYLMDLSNDPSGNTKWFRFLKDISATIFWTGDLKRYKWSGKIVRVKNFDAETRTLTLKVKPIKYTGSIKKTVPLVEGMFCKILFKGKTVKNTIEIPWAALQLSEKIFVVNKNNIVEERASEILNSNNNEIIISSNGFKEGEHIVTQRIPQNIVNGTKVKIISLKKEAKD